MKKLALYTALIMLLVSCQEEIVYQEERFQRIIGFEGSSSAEKVIELDNGDFMVLGKMGISAHELISGNLGVEIGEVEDQAPFIAITDANGYVKRIKSYPLEDLATHPAITPFNLENKMTFLDMIENPAGGYHVLAELRGFDFRINLPALGIDTTFISVPGNQNTTPLLYELDENFNVKEIILFNANPNWDFISRNNPTMKSISNDEFVILFNWKNNVLTGDFIGYSFLHLNHNLDTLGFYENFDSGAEKHAYDFTIQDESLVVMGTDSGAFYLYEHAVSDNFNVVKTQFVSQDGLIGRNNNPQYVQSMTDGNVMVIYTQSFNQIKGKVYDPAFNELNEFEFEGTIENSRSIRAPRSIAQMANGDMLLYSIFIPYGSDEPISGELIKIKPDGTGVFRKNIEGSPGDVLQLRDGNILFASNTVHNELLQRIHLYKIDENGQLY